MATAVVFSPTQKSEKPQKGSLKTEQGMLAFCIMPNHIHLMIRTHDNPLGELMRHLKGRTARAINKTLGNSGQFWAREYFDRYIRDSDHFMACLKYIIENPIKAGLTKEPLEWPGTWIAPDVRQKLHLPAENNKT